MIYLYIKSDVSKNDTTAMATAINQDLLSDHMKIVMV